MFSVKARKSMAALTQRWALASASKAATSCSLESAFPFMARSFSSVDSDEFHTGFVMHYDRSRVFGHIGVDGRPKYSDGVFVHRSHIQSTLNPDDHKFNPYLLPKERVRFQIQTNPDTGKEFAVNVTFESGRLVPPLRPNYLIARMNTPKVMLAEKLLEMTDHGAKEVAPEDIQPLLMEYNQELKRAKEKILSLDMNPEDFTTVERLVPFENETQ